MQITKSLLLTSILALTVALTSVSEASAQDYSGYKYNGNTAQTMQNVTLGRVIAMREVSVDATTQVGQYTGAGLGAVLGGILGSTMGKNGATRSAATVALGAVGAIGGNYAAQAIAREQAYEYIIRLDDGRTVAVTQSYESNNNILVNDEVRILNGGKVRLVKLM